MTQPTVENKQTRKAKKRGEKRNGKNEKAEGEKAKTARSAKAKGEIRKKPKVKDWSQKSLVRTKVKI